MANLSNILVRGQGERGQLMLVTALGIAALLVMLALVLNAVIYTENVAGGAPDGRETMEILRYEHDAVNASQELLRAENAHWNQSYEVMEANVTAALRSWSNLTATHAAREGAVLWTDLNTTEVLITQSTRSAMNASDGASDWTLVQNATTLDRFVVNVSRSSLVDIPDSNPDKATLTDSDVFSISFNDLDSSTVFVYNQSNNVTVHAFNASDNWSYITTASTVEVDFVNGTVDGNVANGLNSISFDGNTDIEIRSGENATAIYTVAFTRGAFGDIGSPLVGRTSGAITKITQVSVDVRYSSPTLEYVNVNRTVRDGGSP